MSDKDTIELKEIVDIFKRRKVYILSFLVFTVLLAILYIAHATPIYRATVTVMIKLEPPRLLPLKSAADLQQTDYWFAKDYYNTQIKIIKSKKVAEKVVKMLNLRDPHDKNKYIDPSYVMSKIIVTPVENTQLVNISVEDPDPKFAAKLANAVADAYAEVNIEERIKLAESAVTWLSKRLEEMKKLLRESQEKLFNFRKSNDIISIENQENILAQKLEVVNKNYIEARAKRANYEARYRYLSGLLKNGDNVLKFTSIFDDPVLEKLREDLVQAQEERARLSRIYSDNHPKIKTLDKQIAFLEKKIKDEIGNLLRKAKVDYDIARNEEENLKKLLDEYKQEVFQLNQKMITYSSLYQDVKKNQKLYDLLLEKLKENDIARHLKENNVSILQYASVPGAPVRPRKFVILFLSLMFGLMGGVLLGFLVDYLDNTIKGKEDVDNYIKLPLLGFVPALMPDEAEAIKKDLFTHYHPKSSISEQIRSIRTAILFMSADNPLKTILITSSIPLEGKSTIVANLGVTMAMNGSRTLIIDADLRRGRLHKTFGLSGEKGLTNLILGQVSMDEAIYPTKIDNLWFLPSGPFPPNPAELLGSARMRDIIEQLKQKFDRILIDSPPVMPVTDPIVLSKMVDGVILVAKIGKVSRDTVISTKNKLLSVNANIIGIILNDLDIRRKGYGYYYGYGYKYYTSEEESSSL